MAAMTGRDTIEESSALWRLARPVLERYVRHLVETDTVDHEGTILKAWRYLRDGAVTPPWKAILVDEYQRESRRLRTPQPVLTRTARPSLRAGQTVGVRSVRGACVAILPKIGPADDHAVRRALTHMLAVAYGLPIAESESASHEGGSAKPRISTRPQFCPRTNC